MIARAESSNCRIARVIHSAGGADAGKRGSCSATILQRARRVPLLVQNQRAACSVAPLFPERTAASAADRSMLLLHACHCVRVVFELLLVSREAPRASSRLRRRERKSEHRHHAPLHQTCSPPVQTLCQMLSGADSSLDPATGSLHSDLWHPNLQTPDLAPRDRAEPEPSSTRTVLCPSAILATRPAMAQQRLQRLLHHIAPSSQTLQLSSQPTAAAATASDADGEIATADLCDDHPNDVTLLPFAWRNFGQSVTCCAAANRVALMRWHLRSHPPHMLPASSSLTRCAASC